MSFLSTVTQDLLVDVVQDPSILLRSGLTNVLFLILCVSVANVYQFDHINLHHVVVKIAGASVIQLNFVGQLILPVLCVRNLVTTKTNANLDLAPALTVVEITLSFIMVVLHISLNVKFKHSAWHKVSLYVRPVKRPED